MMGFKNHRITLASIGLAVGGALGATSLQGCGEGGICGPCGSVLEGSVGISGNAQLDGFFSAVATVGEVTARIDGEFQANIRALAEAWGYADLGAEINADAVAGLMAFIRAEISASVEGGVTLAYAPPKCSADVNVAVEASAQCEAQAGCECEAMVDPGNVSVSCEGQCNGGCDAECTGSVACNASAQPGGISCSGTCEGSCSLEAGGGCSGTCNGTCEGNCSVENAEGECAGSCDGTCTGTCELSAAAECSGSCHGTCVAEGPELMGECMSDLECRGSCSGDCSGSCEGSATPPSASASCECDAKADCEASASAQASANVTCTPPSLELKFNLSGALAGDINAAATFRAKIDALRIRGVAILQGFAQMGALVTGRVNGEVVFEPSPVARIQAEFTGVIDAAASGEFEIAPGRIDCVVPALREAAEVIGSVATDTAGTIEAQAMFSTELFAVAG